LLEEAYTRHDAQTEAFGQEVMQKVERDIFLQTLDNLWMQHLESMDHLRQGINWTAVGQRDPLVEYRRRAQAMFEDMQQQLRHETVRALYHARPVSKDRLDDSVETELTKAAKSSVDNADKILSLETVDDEDFKAVKEGEKAATKAKVSTTKKRKKQKAARKARVQQRKKR